MANKRNLLALNLRSCFKNIGDSEKECEN